MAGTLLIGFFEKSHHNHKLEIGGKIEWSPFIATDLNDYNSSIKLLQNNNLT